MNGLARTRLHFDQRALHGHHRPLSPDPARRLIGETRCCGRSPGPHAGRSCTAYSDSRPIRWVVDRSRQQACIHEDDGDLVLDKTRHSFFAHTELDPMLRSRGITRLITAGLHTDVCVEATVRAGPERNVDVVSGPRRTTVVIPLIGPNRRCAEGRASPVIGVGYFTAAIGRWGGAESGRAAEPSSRHRISMLLRAHHRYRDAGVTGVTPAITKGCAP
ncbi:isochorismatase family protein [Nocardia sp. alder85J]|uniref:isochorismatase family protein n=1 Tax=Nocardia sp. alder85J TaxID=2862949 RepID=UPI001CD47C09|nr:isochorismatase family protein [Nocardia sp. alder85J]MCX4091016.1 isochorismatase family protein [Nocardia sp. alder85J]